MSPLVAALIGLVLTLAEAARRLGPSWAGLAVLLLGAAGAGYWWWRSQRGRIPAFTPPLRRPAELAQEETFVYPARRQREAAWAFRILAGFTALPLVVSLFFNAFSSADTLAGFSLIALFGLLALMALRAERKLSRRIVLSPYGISEVDPNGRRIGIPWSEIRSVRTTRWWDRITIVGRDAGRQVVMDSRFANYDRLAEVVVERVGVERIVVGKAASQPVEVPTTN